MGDAPLAYVEGADGTRVSEDDVLEAGKNDVCDLMPCVFTVLVANIRACIVLMVRLCNIDLIIQGRTGLEKVAIMNVESEG